MSLFSIFDVAGTALSAQSVRINLVSSNLANADSLSSSTERTYRARHPVFEPAPAGRARGIRRGGAPLGVRVAGIVESRVPLEKEYRPDHPQADADGYVYRPNVDVVGEMADMISASRSYQSNVEVMNAAKQMLLRTLSLGQ